MIVWLDRKCGGQSVIRNLGHDRFRLPLHLVIALRHINLETEALTLDQHILVVGFNNEALQIVVLHDKREAVDFHDSASLELSLGLDAFDALGLGWPGWTLGPDFEEVKKPHARIPFLQSATMALSGAIFILIYAIWCLDKA